MKGWRGVRRCGAAAICVFALAGPLRAAESEDPDWPCIQRLVPEISAAVMWAGPPIEEIQGERSKDAELDALAKRITARSLSIDEAKRAVEDFAAGLTDDREPRLTRLFVDALAAINLERRQIMGGIRRYARRQKALAARIEAQTAELSRLAAEDPAAQQARRDELRERLVWDARIYEERERSLTYICEQPVLLEQRIFALAREIMTYLP